MKSQISVLIAFAIASGSAYAADGHAEKAELFRPAPPKLVLTEKQASLVELAGGSRAALGVKVMERAPAAALKQALTQDANTAKATATITLAVTANTVLTASRTSVDASADVGIWRGTVEASGGQVTLMWWPDGEIAGTVQHEGRFYSIRPMGDSLLAVVELSEDRMPPDHAPQILVPNGALALRALTAGLPAPQRGAHARIQPHSSAISDDVTIDVLVAYTKKAASNYTDIKRDLVDLAIEDANESFRMSNLGHVKLRLVHAYETDYVEQGGHFDHVWRLADKGDGYLEEVHGLRNKYRADVVVLVVDDAQGCGLSTRVHADADEAFAVVHHECAATTHSLAHEIGHIIGARHDLNMDPIMTPFAYGHGYVNGTKWRDIMSYKNSCGGCPRVAVWSSPTVFVKGEPAGSAEHNNARVIAEEAARVAAFR
jgi:Metallo-peptidase family M12